MDVQRTGPMPDRLRPSAAARPEPSPRYRVDLNESPFEPSADVREAVRAATAGLNRYPDVADSELAEAVAHHLDVPVAHIAPGAGGVAVLHQTLTALADRGDEVVYPWLSFEGYPILCDLAGARRVPIPLAGADHDLDAMAGAVGERTRAVVVCNPNNPTGTAVRRPALERFLDRIPRHVLVVIDEAYREFVRDPEVPDGIELYRRRPNVAVMRTFSKAYGLAGLRVGFLVAHPPVAEAVRRATLPFSVTAAARAAAVASLRAQQEVRARVDTITARRRRLWTALRGLGWSLPRAEGNFLWLPLGAQAVDFGRRCRQRGVHVRVFPGHGVRVTVGEEAAADIFLSLAAEYVRPPEDRRSA
ncbi:histidinol-phosphate transaminase [Streptomyces sp. NPDC091377]|uniref:histidinol-phosphate transaminase n=1 Tax=Streptomyces sp. NPDC091377 TaxID=3365995 RepID=UPI0038112DEA